MPVPLVSPELPPAASSPSTVFLPRLRLADQWDPLVRVRVRAGGRAQAARGSGPRHLSWAALAGRPAQWFLFVLFKISVSLLFYRFE
jgi:hypothetical protein